MAQAVLTVAEDQISCGGRIDVDGMKREFNRLLGNGRRDLSLYTGNFRHDVFYHFLFLNNLQTSYLWAWLRLGYNQWLRDQENGAAAMMWQGKEFLLKLQFKACKSAQEAKTMMKEARFTATEVHYISSKVKPETFDSDWGARLSAMKKKMLKEWLPQIEEVAELWNDNRVVLDDMELTMSTPKPKKQKTMGAFMTHAVMWYHSPRHKRQLCS